MGLFDRFINYDGAIRLPDDRTVPLVDPSNPVRVGALVSAIIIAIATAVVQGYLAFWRAVFDAQEAIITTMFGIYTDIIRVFNVEGEFQILFSEVAPGLSPLGILRPLGAVAVVLLTVFIAARLAQFFIERVTA